MSKASSKHATLVVGAPRSGTSAISHVLNECGIYFGNKDRFVDPRVNTHNPIFFELEALNQLNERVWAWFGKHYADFNFLPLRSDFSEELRAAFRPLCTAFIENEFGNATAIGLKDPRFCFVLPLWVDALTNLDFQVRCVWMQRPLDSVVASNKRVNITFSPAHNLRIAALSNLAAAYFLEGVDFLRVNYDGAVAHPRETTRAVCDWLGINLDDTRVEAAATVLSAKLRHFTDEAGEPSGIRGATPNSLNEAPAPQAYGEMVQGLRDVGLSLEHWARGVRKGDAATAEDGGVATLINQLSDSNRASQPGSDEASLYWRSATEDWTQSRSISSAFDHGRDVSTCMFELPRGIQLTHLRFDPSHHPGTFLLQAMRIDGVPVVDLQQRICVVNQSVLDIEGMDGIAFTSNDADPWMEIDVDDLIRNGEPLMVEFDCERQALDGETGIGVMRALLATTSGKMEERLQSSISESFSAVAQQLSTLREHGAELDRELAGAREREGALQARHAELEREAAAAHEREGALQARGAELEGEVAAAHEREGALQARHTELEQEVATGGEREARFRQEAFWLAGTTAELRATLDAAQHALGKAHDALDEKQSEIEAMQTTNDDLAARHSMAERDLAEIKSSTIWRSFLVLRSFLLHIPGGIRQALRRMLKAGWWLITPWRIPARIRFLRHRRESPYSQRQDSVPARADTAPLENSGASNDRE